MGRDEQVTEPNGRQDQGGQGHPCPECGALRAPDNTPSCACARRASDALRDTRTAEAAAAEDFDPLRIRPYVDLEGGPGRAEAPLPPADDATMRLQPVPPVLATPLAPPVREPDALDLSLFESAGDEWPEGEADTPRGRRRRALLLAAAAGAVVSVVALAGFASGLFTYETPTRDTAAPEDVRVAVPDATTSEPSESPSGSGTASPSPSASASPSPSPSESESPSPSPSTASPSPSADPTPTATSGPSASPSPTGNDGQNGVAPAVLRRGDRGPEVEELQLRLRQLYLYNSDINGRYSGQVEDAVRNYQWSRGIDGDVLGQYGPSTRARLETETREP